MGSNWFNQAQMFYNAVPTISPTATMHFISGLFCVKQTKRGHKQAYQIAYDLIVHPVPRPRLTRTDTTPVMDFSYEEEQIQTNTPLELTCFLRLSLSELFV